VERFGIAYGIMLNPPVIHTCSTTLKKWVATVKISQTMPGGFNRVFWKRRGENQYKVPDAIKPGDVIEFAYDEIFSASSRKRNRLYYYVTSIHSDYLEMNHCRSAPGALKESQKKFGNQTNHIFAKFRNAIQDLDDTDITSKQDLTCRICKGLGEEGFYFVRHLGFQVKVCKICMGRMLFELEDIITERFLTEESL
jgi:hypothetical protein